MASKPSLKAEAWPIFDHIVADAAPRGVHTNPWVIGSDGQPLFEPDYETLQLLLGVPLYLKAPTQSGVPALALDVWLSYELRRAGFGPDQVWPRPSNPRVLPAAIPALINKLPVTIGRDLEGRISRESSITGATSSSANILGKNYVKQVDVVISDWATGPELLISTKRMDSSYGNNAPNRVEESYGDAKNLGLRHPLAALGFVLGLRSDVLRQANVAAWLFDLLAKLGREDDAYHATCLVLMEYGDDAAVPGAEIEPSEGGILEPGPEPEVDETAEALSVSAVAAVVTGLPKVTIRRDKTPPELDPGRFLSAMVARVLDTTPVDMHEEARRRRSSI